MVASGTGLASTFGHVLGHVRGHGVVIGAAPVVADRPDVDLVTPAKDEFADCAVVARANGDASSGGAHSIADALRGRPGRSAIVWSVRAVETDHCVNVDSPATLVFRHPGEGQPCVVGEAGLGNAGRGGEVAPDATGEAVPELARMCVPQDVGHVVVAVRAERLPDEGVSRFMDGTATKRTSVVTRAPVATRMTPVPSPVDRAEGRRGESDEEAGAVANRRRDALTAEESGADELVGVARVEPGAGRADGCPSVAAADEESFTRFVAGVVVVQDLARVRVPCRRGAGEVDGVGATAGGGDLFYPAGELRILREAYGVAVCFGEVTQARRGVEGGAPVSLPGVACDGGALSGWAAEEAARMMAAGTWSGMAGSLSGRVVRLRVSGWCRRHGRCGTGGGGRSRWCGRPLPCSRGIARGSWAWWSRVLPGPWCQKWEKLLRTQTTKPSMVSATGVCPR